MYTFQYRILHANHTISLNKYTAQLFELTGISAYGPTGFTKIMKFTRILDGLRGKKNITRILFSAIKTGKIIFDM